MNNDEMQEILNRIKERRLSLGLTYQDLADKTGMSKSTLQRYETGFIKNLGIDKLEMLAQALGTTPRYLMGWEESSPVTEEVYDKDEFVFNDSDGNVVDAWQGVKEMFRRDEKWANVAYRVSRELSDEDRDILKVMAKKFLEVNIKR